MASGDIVRIGGIQKYDYKPVISVKHISTNENDFLFPSLTEVVNIQGSGFIRYCSLRGGGTTKGVATIRLEVKIDGKMIFLDGDSTSNGGGISASLVPVPDDVPSANDVVLPFIADSPYKSKKRGVFHELLKFNTSCVIRILATADENTHCTFGFVGGVMV